MSDLTEEQIKAIAIAEAEAAAGVEETGFLQKFGETAKQGAQSLGDFATMNYKEMKDLPATMEFAKKYNDGSWTRLDLQRAFLEQMENNPGGKALGAMAGLVPEFNIITTALNNWVNPAIEKATGADPSTVALTEMALPAAVAGGRKVAGKSALPEVQLPATKMVTSGAKVAGEAAAYPFMNPMKSTAFAVDTALKPVNAITKPLARKFIEEDNPFTGSKGIKSELELPTAQEGMRLQDKFGIEFDAGELTGNQSAINFLDAFANSAKWGSKIAENNKAKTDAIIQNFNKTLDNIYSETTSPSEVGVNISSAYNNTVDKLIKTRRDQAKIDFNSVRGEGATDKYILSNNLFRTLEEIKQEGAARLLTPSKREGAALAKQLLGRLTEKTAKGNKQASTISLDELANGLSDFSAEARGSGGMLSDAKTAAQRRIYARLNEALLKDLDEEINNPKGDPKRAAMLRVARENYRDFSNKISDLEKTTLGKMIGDASFDSEGNMMVSPEKVAAKLTSLSPSEIKRTMDFLESNHPEVASMTKRYMLESALVKAVEGRGLRGEGETTAFPKAKFVGSLPDKSKLGAILKDPKIESDILDVANALNRMIDWGAKKAGSQTAQRTDILSAMRNFAAEAFYKAVSSDTLAQDLMNPTTRLKIVKEAQKINSGGKSGISTKTGKK